jgi:hypothetical protein
MTESTNPGAGSESPPAAGSGATWVPRAALAGLVLFGGCVTLSIRDREAGWCFLHTLSIVVCWKWACLADRPNAPVDGRGASPRTVRPDVGTEVK